MSTISRREFFKNAATGAAVAGFLSAVAPELSANPLGLPIGCQTWPVREMIAKDFPGTIKQLAAAGFQGDRAVLARGLRRLGIRRPRQIHRGRAAENDCRSGCEVRQLSLRHRGAEEKSGGPNCLGQGRRPDPNAGAQPRRAAQPDDGRREARRRRIQQNGRAGGQGRHSAGPSQRGL